MNAQAPNKARARITALAGALLIFLFQGCATQDAPHAWPEKTVNIRQMRPTRLIQTRLLVRTTERSPATTVVLRLHVDETGKVVKTAVAQSGGSSYVDMAAVGAFRTMTFMPYYIDGAATPVTVLAPVHFPAVN